MFIGPNRKEAMLDGRSHNRATRIQNPGSSIQYPLRSGAFTLLEIMLAVTILGMMSLAIFRFVQSNMIALQLSAGTTAGDGGYGGLRDLVTGPWPSLGPLGANIIGDAFKVGERDSG